MSRFVTFPAILLIGCALATSATAGVYKRVNPDGSIEFTDKPEEIGEKPIVVPPPSSYSPPPAPKPAPPAAASKTAVVSYESLTITSPPNDTTIRDNEGKITITAGSKPGLQKGHRYKLLMDGKEAGKGPNNSFEVKNVDRGSHSFTVQIIDENARVIVQSEPVTVHLHRASARRFGK